MEPTIVGCVSHTLHLDIIRYVLPRYLDTVDTNIVRESSGRWRIINKQPMPKYPHILRYLAYISRTDVLRWLFVVNNIYHTQHMINDVYQVLVVNKVYQVLLVGVAL
jgi:hypothetical protein